ncbi:hypothetical protein PIB30_077178 [Stylosanthes scabra]|uniref:Uncharacterized protein n=1 Tax=Stylosanthes scabra TaxID=79078 RepID=A0ABU6RR06_9FABA|nr:hypothetical protein [Stylosanthes scabra]
MHTHQPTTASETTPKAENRSFGAFEENNQGIVISKETKEKTKPEGIEKDSHVSSSNTSTEVEPQIGAAEKAKSPTKATSSHDSGDFLLNIEILVVELHKAASETMIEKAGHSDSLNKSVQQEVKKTIEEPVTERPPTPVN